MDESTNLRDRKKRQTRMRLSDIALDMFEERGFDNVSVAEIAEAAEVSKKTVFNYFPVKEDLIVGRGAHLVGEPARLVRERPVGTTPVEVLREHVTRLITERHPASGLSEHNDVLRIRRLITENPALAMRSMHHREEGKRLLTEELIDEGASEFSSRLMSTQLMDTMHTIFSENFRRIFLGATPDEVYPIALANTVHAFHWLERGLHGILKRNEPYEPASAKSGSNVACG